MESSLISVSKAEKSNRFLKALLWIDKKIIESFERMIVSYGILALSAIVFCIVLTRYFLGHSPDWSDELPRFMVVWITFIGMSYCVRKGEHVVINIFLDKIIGKVKKYIYQLIFLLCFIFFGFATYLGYNLTKEIFESNQMSVSLGISMGYVYLAIPIGCFLTAKNFLHIFIKNLFSKEIIPDLKEEGEL